MDTSLDRIRAKITELETKIADLRIAERELQALERVSAPKTKAAPRFAPKPKAKRKPEAAGEGAPRQTIGAAITEVLDQHGSLSAAEIAEHVKAAGRDITNRTVSFALQALKKRGLAKSAEGKWSSTKARSK
jgi:ribosomal protein L9